MWKQLNSSIIKLRSLEICHVLTVTLCLGHLLGNLKIWKRLEQFKCSLLCYCHPNRECCIRDMSRNANEIQIPYDKHHKVSSLVKRLQNTQNSIKYEVI